VCNSELYLQRLKDGNIAVLLVFVFWGTGEVLYILHAVLVIEQKQMQQRKPYRI
jgi:hypothetical protein